MTAANEVNDDGECERRVKAIVALIESAFSCSIYPGVTGCAKPRINGGVG